MKINTQSKGYLEMPSRDWIGVRRVPAEFEPPPHPQVNYNYTRMTTSIHIQALRKIFGK